MARSASSSDLWGRAVSLVLHDLRAGAGLSYKGLAERTGIDSTKLCFYEHKEVKLRLETIERLAAGYGMTLTEFMAHAETKVAAIRQQIPDPFLKIVTSRRKRKRPRA